MPTPTCFERSYCTTKCSDGSAFRECKTERQCRLIQNMLQQAHCLGFQIPHAKRWGWRWMIDMINNNADVAIDSSLLHDHAKHSAVNCQINRNTNIVARSMTTDPSCVHACDSTEPHVTTPVCPTDQSHTEVNDLCLPHCLPRRISTKTKAAAFCLSAGHV